PVSGSLPQGSSSPPTTFRSPTPEVSAARAPLRKTRHPSIRAVNILVTPSIAGRAVDPLSQEIRVPVMPGVLLNHVHVDPAQVHVRLAVGGVIGLVQVAVRDGGPRQLDLPEVSRVVLLGGRGVGVLQVSVRLLVAAVNVARRLRGEPGPEPGP